MTINNVYFASLFDESSYTTLKDNAYKLIIRPNTQRVLSNLKDVAVTGIIKGGLKYGVEADWDVTGIENVLNSIVSNNGILQFMQGTAQTTMAVGGVGATNSGFVTRLFYTKGGYLSLSPEMRVMDWDNTGEPIKAVALLMAMTLPRKHIGTTINSIIKELEQKIKSFVAATPFASIAAPVINTAGSFVEKAQQNLKNYTGNNNVLKIGANIIGKGIDEALKAKINLTEAPSPVQIEISNYFKHDDMVITSVDWTFSDKITPAGPLFVDISLNLKSREAMVLGENGVENLTLGVKSQNRVTSNT